MLGNIQDALKFQSEALMLRSKRQETLAANIVNADTPNYKAVDFDFAKALKNATHTMDANSSQAASTSGALPMTATTAGHLGGNQGVFLSSASMQFRQARQDSLDGNTVDMDAERSNIADNAVRYEAALRALTGQIKTLQSAMQTS